MYHRIFALFKELFRRPWQIWDVYPSLLYGLVLWLGLAFALCSPWALFPFVLLIMTTLSRLFLLTLLFLAPLPVLHHFYPLEDRGILRIEHVSYNHAWVYQGTLNHRPVMICSKEPHEANCAYFVEGRWKQEQQFAPTRWTPIAKSHSLAQQRYLWQTEFKAFLQTHFKHKEAAAFVGGMVTGHLEHKELRKRFQTLGIAHLLAVSGFHFGILFVAFGHLLFPWMRRKWALGIILVLMTLYYFFVGCTPSVERSWIFITIYLIGELFEMHPLSWNTLGAALLIGMITSPFSCKSISFQLSFLATAGILLFYSPVNRLLCWWIARKTVYEVSLRSMGWGMIYMLLSGMRSLLALTLAVTIMTLPLIFYHFHVFYWHSLFYNVFFPFLAGFSILLLPLYPLCDLYTHLILHIAFHPLFVCQGIYCEQLSHGRFTLITTLIAACGLGYEELRIRHRRGEQPTIYLK